ncbi:hypothetical protein [Leptospira stimsonii]|uniref:Uncharacterized protein n=1 Tax=Leptospira stimsonii TaxID=2202203 RepID=A0ABY2N538_9LEPT|nr:hypothetical protein [Leptospira stimsonii]TGK10350.1 hypothetical protein EHO98_22830 [Leptospira stimsonii]TGM17247.1 hypothetical protein EHQ90_07635 [Leptospira stimsonii]
MAEQTNTSPETKGKNEKPELKYPDWIEDNGFGTFKVCDREKKILIHRGCPSREEAVQEVEKYLKKRKK